MLVDDLTKLIKSGQLDEGQVWAITEARERCKRLDHALEFLNSIYEVAKACEPYCKEEAVMKIAVDLIQNMACVVP